MNLFAKRPLALFCASSAAAALLGAWLTQKQISIHLPLALLFVLLSALFLAVPIFLHRFRPHLLTPILALLFAALALLQSHVAVERKLDVILSFGDEAQRCQVEILEKEVSKSYLSVYLVKLTTVDDTHLNTRAEVSFPFYTDFSVGDCLESDFSLQVTTNDPENASYRLSNGILVELESVSEEITVTDHRAPDLLTEGLAALKNSLSEFLSMQVGGEEGNLVSSLLLGKRELLEPATKRDFRRTGTTHLLAISGMHLSVIVLLIDRLLRVFGVRKKPRCVVILLITLGYLALTGFALSACRAFLMCCFVYLSWLFHGDNDTVTSLFFALFFILFVSPLSVYDIGMWMSVLAVLGILVALRSLEFWREKLRRKGWSAKRVRRVLRPVSAICISLAAELFILYPMWIAFDELSLVALPCGLLLSPLVTLLLFLTPFLFFFAWLPPVATLLGKLLYGISHLALEAVGALSRLRGITVSLEHGFFAILIPIFSITIALLLVVRLKRKWPIPASMGAALMSIALFLCFLRLPATESITADYYGKKDNALLVFSAREESVVCDVTSGAYTTIGEARTLLAENTATEISAYVLTHYHQSHVSSLSRLLSNTLVRALYLPVPQNENELGIHNTLLALAENNDCEAILYERGVPLSLGDLTLKISNEVYLKRSTHPTFYVEASAFGTTLCYVGESLHEDEALYEELCQTTENADLLILGIHGPITKTAFSYPLGNMTVLTDPLLLDHMVLEDAPTGKILCESTRITLPME